MTESHSLHLGPLIATRCERRLVFTLAASPGFELELPAKYEEQLRAELGAAIEAEAGTEPVIDLQDLPAITSRQLGALLAVQRVYRVRQTRIAMVNISETVRRVLAATNTKQFFELG